MTFVLKGLPDEDPNTRMAELIERDAEEQEQRDLLLDWQHRDLPIFAAAVLAYRQAPCGERSACPPCADATAPGAGFSPPCSVSGAIAPASSSHPEQGGRDAR